MGHFGCTMLFSAFVHRNGFIIVLVFSLFSLVVLSHSLCRAILLYVFSLDKLTCQKIGFIGGKLK